MGMYTELILGAELKKDVPDIVVNTLKYLVGDIEEKPRDFPLTGERSDWMLQMGSYYFAINNSVCKMWFDDIDSRWHISTRSNLKNYDGEIEEFLEWLKPYIDGGSGFNDMYAIVMYEEAEEPTIYYLNKYMEGNN